MLRAFLFWFVLAETTVIAQECSCVSQFDFVKTYFETNSPAFQTLKADKNLLATYRREVIRIEEEVGREPSIDRCNLYLDQYITLLKDHHSGIDLNVRRIKADLNDDRTIDSLKATESYRSFPKIEADTAALVARLRSKSQHEVEGLYTNGGSILFALTQAKPGFYQGVVIKKNKLLDVGHVLLTLTARKDNKFDCIYNAGLLAINFQHIYQTIELKDGRMPAFGFYKVGFQDPPQDGPYEFRSLDGTTNYLRLSSFHSGLKQELASFYDSISTFIQKKPYLIIDLRDNGGGSEECYFDLVKYIYTKPLRNDDVEVWVTPDNIKRYEEAGYPAHLIERMRNAKPGSFIPQVENAVTHWELKGTVMPKKVALLFNQATASSAEGMISYFMQSEKVITLGQHSGGYMGYGNVSSTLVPCGRYSIRCTTTRYKSRSKYEFVGIAPQILLTEKQDWVKEAQAALKKLR